LQTELAEAKSQSLHSQKLLRWAQQIYITKEKVVTLNTKKSCVCRREIDPKYLDKLKPEPGPTGKARPEL